MAYNRSVFPEGIDKFIKVADLSPSLVAKANRYKELKMKMNKVQSEVDELNSLTIELQNYIVSPELINHVTDAMENLENFFSNDVTDFVNDMKNTIIEHIDGTTAGAIRNDLGIMSDLKTQDKNSLVEATNEVYDRLMPVETVINSMGLSNGIATLDELGNIPLNQLPVSEFILSSTKGQPNGIATLNNEAFIENLVKTTNVFEMAGNFLVFSDYSSINNFGSTTPKRSHHTTMRRNGIFRISFELSGGGSGVIGYGQLYVNGKAIGSLRTSTDNTFILYTLDVQLKDGDLLELKIHGSASTYYVHARNFTIGVREYAG